MSNDYLDRKPQELRDQLDVLNEKISSLRKELGYLAGGAIRFERGKEVEQAEQERRKLIETIEDLNSNRSVNQLYRALLRLDYADQVLLFQQCLVTNKIGAFLIHGSPEHGQRWLLNRLLQRICATSKVIRIDLSRRTRRNDMAALWKEIAGRVGILKPNPAIEEIIDRICRCRQTQNVILVLDEVDYLPEGFLNQLILDFWKQLACVAGQTYLEGQAALLLMFLVDYSGSVEEQDVAFAASPPWRPDVPIKLPAINQISAELLTNWIHNSIDDLPYDFTAQVGHTVQSILESTDNGVPERVMEQICTLCGYDWYEGEQKWLRF
jgi:hypothetical protein